MTNEKPWGQYYDPKLLPKWVIHWIEAKSHIGEHVSVYGEICSTYFDWKTFEMTVGLTELQGTIPPTFLAVGQRFPHPDLVEVVIWGSNRGKFEQPPDELFDNKTVIVSGKLYLYHDAKNGHLCDRPTIYVSDPSQIKIVDSIPNLVVDIDARIDLDGTYAERNGLKPLYPRAEDDFEEDFDDPSVGEVKDPPYFINWRGDRCPVMRGPDGDCMYYDEEQGAWLYFDQN